MRRAAPLGLIGVLLVLGVALWMRAPAGVGTAPQPGTDAVPEAPRDDPTRDPSHGVGGSQALGNGAPRAVYPLDHTVKDRAVRDELIRQMALARATEAVLSARSNPPTRPDGAMIPMPEQQGSVDPGYLRDRIREDFIPMAQTCYESFRVRQPGSGAATVRMAFTITGDVHLGGVVEDATVDRGDAGFGDPELETCLRASMETMAFRPPPHSGRITVHYPFHLSPETPDH